MASRADNSNTGTLYMVGTPIGNLNDMSPRVAEAFTSADAICCEDTRVTSKLLTHLGISRPLIRCDENVIASRVEGVLARVSSSIACLRARPWHLPLMRVCRACRTRVRCLSMPRAMLASMCR